MTFSHPALPAFPKVLLITYYLYIDLSMQLHQFLISYDIYKSNLADFRLLPFGGSELMTSRLYVRYFVALSLKEFVASYL